VRGRRLQAVRAQLFRAHPFCVQCRIAVATIRDHVIPLAEGGVDDDSNVQALCQMCSDAKTAAEARRGQTRRYP
jgi:5-methylcytosine-specific restriction protein A